MNNQIFFFFYNLAHQSLIFDNIIIFFAVYFPFLVIILAGLFLLFHHEIFRADNPYQVFLQKKKEIIPVFFASILAWIFSQILKYIIQSPRPFDLFTQVQSIFPETGYAFPSGHATFFMALAVALFLNHKKTGYIFMTFALIIGLARITGGVHFPIDILGGFVLGGAVSYLVAYLAKSV
ncbi:MAG: phosphatase PAP2 family protein [Candidatus Paceibacterota bacterium]